MLNAEKSVSGTMHVEGVVKPLKILLAEDCENNVLLVQLYLKKFPYSIDVAENGHVAFEFFQRNEYDVVLMDIEMPVTDGYEATLLIRDFEMKNDRAKTPIVAVTAHALPENEDRAYEVGCDFFLTKPVRKADLISTVQKYGNGEA
ncbi:response regulator [Desulfovibrio sp. JC010]|uniref:response regulator n=1 Tax=Desulfovibrio sp. JC010 TaxID=2593641 RepID=UPI0013D67F04|nr:response regulator [Desulfovibrio sp. JC010]NDV26942.1 response regulator [Desulfovibrio sp. JC010]